MRKAFSLLLSVCILMGTSSIVATNLYTQTTTKDSTVNLIKGGDFENGLGIWSFFTAEGGEGNISVEQGQLKASVEKCGTVAYGMQVYYDGFKLYKNGKYTLKFDISSTVNRDIPYRIQLNGGDYRGYIDGNVKVTGKTQTVTADFTMNDETDKTPRLAFNLGKDETQELAPHDVKIDNVQLYLVDDSKVVYDEEEVIEEKQVVLNQLGYKPNDNKKVIFRGDIKDSKYKVVSVDTNKVVYEGNISGNQYNEAAKEKNQFGDFSEVKIPGVYKIVTDNEGSSYEFTIGEDVYAKAFNDAVKMFYMQRCGVELPTSYAGKWSHKACHTTKAKIYGTNDYIDVSGGWHDAGDYGRYVIATSKTLADLLTAYENNKVAFGDDVGIPESKNGTPDILDEARYQLDWLFKMQNQSNGGVYHKVTCAGFPGYIMPEGEVGELIVCPISTTATGDFAAVMAMAYDTYKDRDANFANKCLEASKKAWVYLDKAPSSSFTNPEGISTGEYGDKSDRDERYWAAAQLFKATGENKYHDKFKAFVNQGLEGGYDWSTVGNFGNAAYLKAASTDLDTYNKVKAAMVSQANEIVAAAKSDSYGISNGGDYYWGSNMALLNNAVTLVTANTISPNKDYVDYAKEQINYCFGKNPMCMSYVTGYGSVYPKNPHHRPSIAQKTAVPGMIIGGPNDNLEDSYAKAYLADAAPAKCYLDNAESYSTNEVDIYWNSSLVSALAQVGMVGDAKISAGGNQGETETGGEVSENNLVKVDVSTTANNSVNQKYTIACKGNEKVDLSKLEIKYYYTKGDSKKMTFWCDSASVQLNKAPWYIAFNNTTGAFGSDEKGTYLQIKLNQVFELQPGVGTVELQTRFANNDWSNMDKFSEKDIVVIYNGIVLK